MKTKLTLVLEDEIIAAAKQYAKESGRSLSEIVSNYFKAIAKPPKPKEEKAVSDTPITDSLVGILKMPKGFDGDYDRLLEEARLVHFKNKYDLD